MRHCELHYLSGGEFFRLAWTEWGSSASPVVVCVHGLTRQGRDFDVLAQALADEFRVVCVDLPGRGRSEWLPQAAMYALPTYVAALSYLIAMAGRPVGWVGTSLGGLCGMAIAAMPGQPIGRMVVNDIGPFIPAASLARIAAYMREAPATFEDFGGLEAYLRRVHAPFGTLGDAHWAAMAACSARPLPDGRIALHYDPAIAAQVLSSVPEDVDLWLVWDRIAIPRLALRGAASDLLPHDVFDRMVASGASGHVVEGAGHAPALMDAPTIAVVRRFLRGE